ncbi:MAG: pseudouridine synthase [Ardenticatenales bacterium]|nr:pseudouridine synthase [Ardenticatenales bacterium]
MSRYLLFNKPYLVLPSFSDPDFERGEIAEPRPTLADYIAVAGVYPAGRLDYDSEGLLFLTDDGDLAHRITHPHFHHPKTYLVQVEGIPEESALEKLRRGGLAIKEYRTAPAQARLLREEPALWPRVPPIRERPSIPTAWLELTLTEGKKRQVRRMTAAVGYPTLRLVRASIGPLRLGALPPGQWRDATSEEMAALRALLRQGQRPRDKRRTRR